MKLWVAVCMLLALMAIPAFADGNGTIVIHKGTGLCGMPGADANGNITFGGVGSVWLSTTNDQKVQLTCKGSAITNDSGKGQHFTGFTCGVIDANGNGYLTTDSEATVSASGQATLTCRVKPPVI